MRACFSHSMGVTPHAEPRIVVCRCCWKSAAIWWQQQQIWRIHAWHPLLRARGELISLSLWLMDERSKVLLHD